MTEPRALPPTPDLPGSPSRRWFGCLVIALVALVCFAPQGMAQPGGGLRNVVPTLEQCANGTTGIGDCTGTLTRRIARNNTGWVNGDLNQNNSLYREGDLVPFRSVITGLTLDRTYTLTIGYDAIDDGLHAYDYLGSYNGSEHWPGPPPQLVIPCVGVADTAGTHACGSSPSTLPVPEDTNTTLPDGSHPPPTGSFSAWGALLTDATYVVDDPPISTVRGGTVERQIGVTFKADGPTAVLAWGGHIASALDWGVGNTFVSAHSGASFHMSLHGITGGSLGQEDLSLHAAALAPAPGLATQVAPTSMTTDETVIDTATLVGVAPNPVTGAVQFVVCGPNASAPPDCTAGGTLLGPPQVVNSLPGSPATGKATIAFPQQGMGPVQPGRYCFRAEYTPSADAQYSPTSHTDTTTECFLVTLPPPLLTVTKLCNPESDPGLFNLLLDGTPISNGTDVPCSESRGPFETTVGLHTISESAGTGTDLADYTSTFGGDCAPGGSLTLALGDSAICTITNTKTTVPPTPPAALTVHKICDPTDDPGNFQVMVDDRPVAVLSCGESAGPVELAPGTYTLREASGEDTSLSDYTTVISGDCAQDGSITLASGQSATCAFTNTRIPPIPPPATLRVDKACDPAGDDGHFRLGIFTIDGRLVHRVVVGCGGTTGTVQVDPGTYVVRERGAGGTDLADYTRYVGGDCQSDGTITLAADEDATCLITNVRRGTDPRPAELTVAKVCVPADDRGRFDLNIDDQTLRDAACGHSFGPVALAPGQHRVSESAGTGTSLSDYVTTIGGACAPDGSVTLAAGQQATCTITNVRTGTQPPEPPLEQTGTVEIEKRCAPAGTQGNFQLEFDEQVFHLSCGQSTGPVEVPVGDHRVGEVAVSAKMRSFETTIGGDCSPSGSFTLGAGQRVTCVVTNTLVPPKPPLKPPPACHSLTVGHRSLTVGRAVLVLARVELRRRPVRGVRVYAVGPGVSAVRTTGPRGRALFVVTPSHPGVLRVTIRKPFGCPKPPPKKIGILATTTPLVTG